VRIATSFYQSEFLGGVVIFSPIEKLGIVKTFRAAFKLERTKNYR